MFTVRDMQWGMPCIVAQCTCLRKLLTTFTLCFHTSVLCGTTEVHSVNSYWGCGKVFHTYNILWSLPEKRVDESQYMTQQRDSSINTTKQWKIQQGYQYDCK